MKKFLVLSLTMFLFSCGSYNSIDSFYEAHKNDNQVTAIRVPKFMFSLIGQLSPEMESMVNNTKDLRYMRFPSATDSQSRFLNTQMNNFTSNSFIEIFRKNDELKRNVIAVREKRDVVKEILIYNNDNLSGSFMYFKGDFNPAKVRELAKGDEFQKLSNGLLTEFKAQTPGILDN